MEDSPARRALELLSSPCQVTGVSIVGNRRTKRGLIEAELRSAIAANTYEALAVELALAHQVYIMPVMA